LGCRDESLEANSVVGRAQAKARYRIGIEVYTRSPVLCRLRFQLGIAAEYDDRVDNPACRRIELLQSHHLKWNWIEIVQKRGPERRSIGPAKLELVRGSPDESQLRV